MPQSVLILGATGRFGRNAALAFRNVGWTVHSFDRTRDTLEQAARGVDVIVNGWNPSYPDWARLVPGLHQQVIKVAEETGATVLVPGNVYVFGPEAPGPWYGGTPHKARNPLGRVRIEMEEAYRRSTARTIILRAGDFIDTCASGNWFDQVMIKHLAKGRLVYPGNPDIPHAWAYLPDLAHAAVLLAEKRHELPRFCDVPFEGYTLTGSQIARALSRVTGRSIAVKPMQWWPLHLARPFWRMAPHLVEMRYLWQVPHQLDGTHLTELLGAVPQTDLDVALCSAIPTQLVAPPPATRSVGGGLLKAANN
ncbi:MULTISPECIES: epimerase [unclassified Ruegeria]|uniref:epimerase n=1 Tax=unclassified Ruegeria TaxID=2625375 RepID=UPI001489DA3E|nr:MULTISPECIES: epimerase [unclassified Ruegeria]NOD90609.1 epimerase [Ruegeria sp. HKCCD4318]NOE15888.1 epimerase [Ruegeria sp. HKCCD4318-2]NOG10780.1 epimerase [Ruegeria sp. HKCCD4315]